MERIEIKLNDLLKKKNYPKWRLARISGVDYRTILKYCKGEIKRRLLDIGLIKDTKIIPVLKSPSGDPRAFSIRGSLIAIRKEDARNIEIEEVKEIKEIRE